MAKSKHAATKVATATALSVKCDRIHGPPTPRIPHAYIEAWPLSEGWRESGKTTLVRFHKSLFLGLPSMSVAGVRTDTARMQAHVANWHKADIPLSPGNVAFGGKADPLTRHCG